MARHGRLTPLCIITSTPTVVTTRGAVQVPDKYLERYPTKEHLLTALRARLVAPGFVNGSARFSKKIEKLWEGIAASCPPGPLVYRVRMQLLAWSGWTHGGVRASDADGLLRAVERFDFDYYTLYVIMTVIGGLRAPAAPAAARRRPRR